MTNIKIIKIEKKSFSVIGKMGQGYSKESSSWIPKLWEEANTDFSRITSLVKYNADGSIFGLWGLMSDTEEKFLRWSESGKYLAGCEVDNGVLPPEGFTKWTVPTQKYIVAECSLVYIRLCFLCYQTQHKHHIMIDKNVHSEGLLEDTFGQAQKLRYFFPQIQACGFPANMTVPPLGYCQCSFLHTKYRHSVGFFALSV